MEPDINSIVSCVDADLLSSSVNQDPHCGCKEHLDLVNEIHTIQKSCGPHQWLLHISCFGTLQIASVLQTGSFIASGCAYTTSNFQ